MTETIQQQARDSVEQLREVLGGSLPKLQAAMLQVEALSGSDRLPASAEKAGTEQLMHIFSSSVAEKIGDLYNQGSAESLRQAVQILDLLRGIADSVRQFKNSSINPAAVSSFNVLIAGVADRDQGFAASCIKALTATNDPEAIIHLSKVATDATSSVKMNALQALKDNRSPVAVRTFIEASVCSQSSEVRSFCENELKAPLSESVLTTLIEATKNREWIGREKCYSLLAANPSLRSIDALCQGLQDPDPDIRRICTNALHRMNRTEGWQAHFENLLSDERGLSRDDALCAFRFDSTALAVKVLADKLKDSDPKVRSEAADQLTGNREPYIIELLTQGTKDPDPNVRRSCAYALVEPPNRDEPGAL